MNIPTTAHNPEGEAVVNDSPVGCQSRRTDRSIFSAEKMQDRWFKSFSRNQSKTLENTEFSRVFHLPKGLELFEKIASRTDIGQT
jgi:hypothetical protein